MTVTLNANPGDPSANAYCTAAQADTYHATRGQNPEWAAIPDQPTKETYVMWATRKLDELDWYGGRRTVGQALRWPRAGLVDRDGYPVDYTGIPAFLVNATAEYAYQLWKQDWTQGQGPLVSRSIQVGSLRQEGEWFNPIPPSVVAIIRPYVSGLPGNGCMHVTRS